MRNQVAVMSVGPCSWVIYYKRQKDVDYIHDHQRHLTLWLLTQLSAICDMRLHRPALAR
jgi:hypothetical protein